MTANKVWTMSGSCGLFVHSKTVIFGSSKGVAKATRGRTTSVRPEISNLNVWMDTDVKVLEIR